MSSHKTRVKHVTQAHRVVEKKVEKVITTYDVTRISISCGDHSSRSGTHATWHSDVNENALPFAVPKSEKDHEKINALLKFCKEQQKEFDITNRPGFVEVILQRCLKAIGVKSSIVYGWRDICGPSSFVHIWLKINQHHVDNTYWGCQSSFHYLIRNYPSCYTPVESFETTPAPHSKGKECEYVKKRRIKFFIKYPDHGLALCLNREKAYNFYFSMIRYMFEQHEVSVQGVDPKVRYHCWNCFKFPKAGLSYLSHIIEEESEKETRGDDFSTMTGAVTWKYPQCSVCLVANYCSRKCQEEDFSQGHDIYCLPKDIPFLPDSFD